MLTDAQLNELEELATEAINISDSHCMPKLLNAVDIPETILALLAEIKQLRAEKATIHDAMEGRR